MKTREKNKIFYYLKKRSFSLRNEEGEKLGTRNVFGKKSKQQKKLKLKLKNMMDMKNKLNFNVKCVNNFEVLNFRLNYVFPWLFTRQKK